MLQLPFVIGHRGACAYAPENTLASIRKAAAIGLSWVEVDVMLTEDNVPVIFHDETVSRTTNGQGRLREASFAYIDSLDAGAWFHPRFAGEKVPTLQSLLACCQVLNLSLNLELKVCDKEAPVLVKKVLQVLKTQGLQPPLQILLSSFSLETLRLLKVAGCPYPLAWNVSAWVPAWEIVAQEMGFYSIHFPAEVLTKTRVASVKQHGQHVLAYTVNQAAKARCLAAMGVDAVFSDAGDKIKL